MANPEIDKLITELSSILERNRQARMGTEAQLAGIRQGMMGPISSGGKGAAAMGAGLGEAAKGVKGAMSDEAPRTAAGGTSADRVKLAQQYAAANADPDPTGLGKISPNYRAESKDQTGLGKLSANYRDGGFGAAYEQAMAAPRPQYDQAAQEEYFRKLAAPQSAQAAQVQKAGNPDLGRFGSMTSDAFQGQPQQPPAGWSPKDYALLDALSQRYPQ